MQAVKCCYNQILQFLTDAPAELYNHWRLQLWGTGARAPSTYNNLIISVHFDLCKVKQRLYVDSFLL